MSSMYRGFRCIGCRMRTMADRRVFLSNLVTGVLVSCAIVVTLAVVRREFFPGSSLSPSPPEVREIEGWEEVVSGGLRFGSLRSDVVVVEFADFQCPFCVTVAHSLRELRSEFAGQVSFVYRHFPLTSIHEHAMDAAIASECAARQGAFERYHDLLYEEQDAIGVREWTVFAEMAGVPSMDKFRSCLEDDWPRARVMEDARLARRLRLDGTPSVIVNGTLLPGTPSLETLRLYIGSSVSESGGVSPGSS